jgi:hypothetical protein
MTPASLRPTSLEEATDREVALKANRDFIIVSGLAMSACFGQQLGARCPVRLILGEPGIGGHCLDRLESDPRTAQLRDGQSAIDGDDR